MSDPAVDAAQRAWRTASHGRHGDLPSSEKVTAMITDAAREALRPIKQMWRREMGVDSESNVNERFQRIGRELARLIFTDDEMDGGSPGE